MWHISRQPPGNLTVATSLIPGNAAARFALCLLIKFSVFKSTDFSQNLYVQVPTSDIRHSQYSLQYNTINERSVRCCSTNHPGAPYNNNNKSVSMIKQNSFKSFLEYVSVSNVMYVRWQSVPGSRTGVVETTFAKLGACSRQYVVSHVTRSESVPVTGWRNRGDTVTQILWSLTSMNVVHQKT